MSHGDSLHPPSGSHDDRPHSEQNYRRFVVGPGGPPTDQNSPRLGYFGATEKKDKKDMDESMEENKPKGLSSLLN